MLNVFVLLLAAVVLGYYGFMVHKVKFNTRILVMIGLMCAVAFILNSIKIYSWPQGGSVSLCSMLPIFLLSFMYGPAVGMTGGLVLGFLSLLNGFDIIHPAQFLLDYFLPYMLLGIAGIWGYSSKFKVLLGSVLAVLLSVGCQVLSGVIFYYMYAPEGVNLWWYSLTVNFSTNGVEGLMSIIVLMCLPIGVLVQKVKR